MQIGIDSFAAAYDRRQSPGRSGGSAAQPDRADRARRSGRAGRLRNRRAPPRRVPRLRPGGHPRRGGGANAAHPPHQRRDGPELGRPGAGLPELRDPRPPLAGPRRDGRRPRLVHRVVPAVRPAPRGLRLALRREARPAAEDPRQRARPLVRQAPAAAHRPGRVPATGAGPAADLARRRRDAGLVRSRRRARPAADGRDHRRRDAALPAARRPLPGGRQSARDTRPTSSRSACTRSATSPRRPRRPPTTSSRATRAPSPTVAKERGWPPVTRADFDAQRGPEGALLVGSPDEVAEKIARHSEALGGHLAHHASR